MENIQKLDLLINITGPIIGHNIVYKYNINTNPQSYNSSLFVPTNYSLEEAMKYKRLTRIQKQEIFTDKKKLEEFGTKVKASEKSNISKVIEEKNAIYIIKILFNTDIKGKAIFYVKNHKFIVENNVKDDDIISCQPKFFKNTKVTTSENVDINKKKIPKDIDLRVAKDSDKCHSDIEILSRNNNQIYIVPGSSLKISMIKTADLSRLAIVAKQDEIKTEIESPYKAYGNIKDYRDYINREIKKKFESFMSPQNEQERNKYIKNYIAKYNEQFNIKKEVTLSLTPNTQLLNHLAKQKDKHGNPIFNIKHDFKLSEAHKYVYHNIIKHLNCSTQKNNILRNINSLCAKEKEYKHEREKRLTKKANEMKKIEEAKKKKQTKGGRKRKIRKITKKRKKGGDNGSKKKDSNVDKKDDSNVDKKDDSNVDKKDIDEESIIQELQDKYRKVVGYPLIDLKLCSRIFDEKDSQVIPNITDPNHTKYFPVVDKKSYTILKN